MARTVAEKLRMLPGSRALLLNAPPGYPGALGLSAELDTHPQPAPYDVVQVFVTSAEELSAQLAAARPALGSGTILWITYPKLSSRQAGALNRNVLYALLQEQGFQAVAQVAVDETWSAMRFKPR